MFPLYFNELNDMVTMHSMECDMYLKSYSSRDDLRYVTASSVPYDDIELCNNQTTVTLSQICPEDTDMHFTTPSSPSSGTTLVVDYISDNEVQNSSDSNDTDGEYAPPSVVASCKRRGGTCKSYRRATSSVSTSSSCSSSSNRSTKRVRSSSPSRNLQADTAMSAVISRALKVRSADQTDFICPVCSYEQMNRRMPDFKRHLRTHLRSKKWSCKGALLEEAVGFDVPEDSKPYIFLGRQRIGGCLLNFSRRDALKRHLDKCGCIGNPSAAEED
ncbi:hypothetical protein BDQ17DRAFT_1297003 [Cyathus striatus]|nr:hypothetical protein BDQ17DRAFT_1297003 [Cyathus striatus]